MNEKYKYSLEFENEELAKVFVFYTNGTMRGFFEGISKVLNGSIISNDDLDESYRHIELKQQNKGE